MSILDYFASRARERTSQAAMASILMAAVPVIQGHSDWRDMLGVAAAAIVTILLPEAGVSAQTEGAIQ